jgi:hypothetical protein
MSGFLDMPRIGILNPSLDLHMFLDYELFDPMLIRVYLSYERTSNIGKAVLQIRIRILLGRWIWIRITVKGRIQILIRIKMKWWKP